MNLTLGSVVPLAMFGLLLYYHIIEYSTYNCNCIVDHGLRLQNSKRTNGRSAWVRLLKIGLPEKKLVLL